MNAHTTPAAENMAQPVGFPRLNEPAPAFDALTTDGRKTLADYKGKWLILFSHPADFTPVCTTEFVAFAERAEEFAAIDTELLGLSIDSHYAHIAWMRSIKETFGVDIPFPIIADLDMKVAQAFGMIQPGASDTQAVRATFIIDPDGILRAMVYYPMTNGRSVDEFVRLVKALQTSDAHKVATPENWQPGQDVIVPTPQTADAAEARMAEGFETKDWYFSTRSL
ncbi:Selenocysteine-containing peroxiredoxin PrxU [Roseivivax sp. THAF40]|uniref:peroxiredoxin n=1 Tax=unclassified Roseivivax TaxID=2639302 RepID=UPI0012A9C43D|nr:MULTISPECIES: peroxiredoxin [unclassified Roseivivax]QFS84028.1 Selenocysteine-containing peroxiredoxin PrxU [Roseivivax sp. THAF197b]QFT47855.1 Selenocysteine-containing peroxiredoxin PrxU [Roseivivax sp. THAF40]